MEVTYHECGRCRKVFPITEPHEKRYKFYMLNGKQVRRYYFLICKDCAGGQDGQKIGG